MIQDDHSILIIEMGGIGDLVMAIPAIRAIRNSYPHSYMAALVAKRAKPLLKGCPYLDEVFTFEIDNFTFSIYAFNFYETAKSLKTVVSLRRKRFKFAINLHRIASFWGSLRMRSLFKVIGPEVSVGRNTDGRGEFYSVKLPEHINDSEHEVMKKLRLISMLGVPIDNNELELWIDAKDKHYIDRLFGEYGIEKEELIVGINPNSAQRSKLWLEERFAELADLLNKRYKAKIIFLGSNRNRERIRKILSLSENTHIDLSGRLTLTQYAALIQRLKVFITLDSGPMHIASVFKVPTIALFGPGYPSKFGPYRNDRAFILKEDKMSAIDVYDVINSFDAALKKNNIA